MKFFWPIYIVIGIIAEFLGLTIFKGGSASEFIWRIEGYVRGQGILHWSFGHLLIAVFFATLFFHFAFRMWP